MAIIRSISLDEELNRQVQKYCKDTGRTVSGLISVLLTKHIFNGTSVRGYEINGIEAKGKMLRNEVQND